jgi:alpha-1,6-mannosyltransferase
MKIVDLTSLYSHSGGGIRTYLREKTARLSAAGHVVHRVIPGAAAAVRRTSDGAVEHTLRGPSLPFDRNYHLFGSLRQVGELLHELAPDVVEVGSHYILPWRIRELAPRRARIVGFLHSNLPDTFVAPALRRLPPAVGAAAQRLSWRAVRAAHQHYDATLCASRHVEERLREHRVPRVVRVGLGVDLQRFAPQPSAPQPRQVCYVGRLSRDKEAELLLAVAPQLAACGLTLVVAGDGPLAARFERAPTVRYLGSLQPPQVATLLAGSAACVVPGRYETFSLAAAEALACGTPVLAAELGAAAELVTASGCGDTFRCGDAASLLAAALRQAALPDERRARARVAGRTFAERELAWSAVLARVLAAYRGGDAATDAALRPGAPRGAMA